MTRIVHWCKEEITRIVPAIIYFAICFNLFHYAQGLMLRPGDVRFTSYLGATLGAILAGKVIIIVESMPFINAFPSRPIICNILWKFFIYSIFVLLVQILDHLVQRLYHSGSFTNAYVHLKIALSLPMFWGIQIIVLMFFLIFIIFSELIRVLGRARMQKIFLGNL